MTYDGSFRLPRFGIGAMNGQSVSTNNLSAGIVFALVRSSSAYLQVTDQEKTI